MSQTATRTETLIVNGAPVRVVITRDQRVTIATVIMQHGGKIRAIAAYAVCHPNDAFDAAAGEKLAMKRACRIDAPFFVHHEREIYSAWRKAQGEKMLSKILEELKKRMMVTPEDATIIRTARVMLKNCPRHMLPDWVEILANGDVSELAAVIETALADLEQEQ